MFGLHFNDSIQNCHPLLLQEGNTLADMLASIIHHELFGTLQFTSKTAEGILDYTVSSNEIDRQVLTRCLVEGNHVKSYTHTSLQYS